MLQSRRRKYICRSIHNQKTKKNVLLKIEKRFVWRRTDLWARVDELSFARIRLFLGSFPSGTLMIPKTSTNILFFVMKYSRNKNPHKRNYDNKDKANRILRK